MAADFLKLEKLNPMTLIKSPKWKNCTPQNCLEIYEILSTLNKPHGKGINTPIENFDLNMSRWPVGKYDCISD
jgi:hypothetical protein